MVIVYCDFMAGCIGGACGTLIGHPFDTIKTWQQFGNRRIRKSIYDIVIRNNGLNGFFRGMAFPMMSSGILNSILFGVYGNELRRLQNICTSDAERKIEWAQNVFLAGSTAGLIHAFFACPIELIKIRLQTQNHHNYWRRYERQGPINCIKTVYRNEGLIGFYRGWTPMICRDVFPYGIYMLAYEYVSRTLSNSEWVLEKRERFKELQKYDKTLTYLDISIPILSGAFAGFLSWILVIPFDVIKTVVQAETDITKHGDMVQIFKAKTNKYGWKIFFRGSWIILVRSLPTNAATFLVKKI
ncbi:solute carrier family 25 member 45-like isoform X2 [Contarinia nasturtii]|uniref:solute carrier family 25 member 45-like isoform X2 n=1 Tax=Contarinia nasturtii TaxID=265458 RepID=UPI0012D40F53|nr:solute carrier family 25 member 45-like isoform X2 [Contarinia nasturtii]